MFGVTLKLYNDYAYSRVKQYIVNGKAYSYEYDQAGNIVNIQSPDGDTVSYEYDSLNQLKKETYLAGDGVLDVKKKNPVLKRERGFLERLTRLELATSTLARGRSTR